MKNLFLLISSSLLLSSVFAQPKPTAMNREDYMTGCLETAKSLPNVPAKEYCDCTYEKLISQLTEDEINDFLDFMSSGAEQDEAVAYAMSKPKIMNIIMGCLDPDNYNEKTVSGTSPAASSINFSDLSKKEVAEIKQGFMKECQNGLKANPVSKDFNNKLYCNCAWEKIINTGNAMDYFLDYESQASQDLIQKVAVQCVTEQLGGK
jgi:hypothetical protein